MHDWKGKGWLIKEKGCYTNRGENSVEGICKHAGMREAGVRPMRGVAEPPELLIRHRTMSGV